MITEPNVMRYQGSSPQGSIHICPNGCVCMNFGVTSIHLKREQFRNLLDAMLKAADRLGLEPHYRETMHETAY